RVLFRAAIVSQVSTTVGAQGMDDVLQPLMTAEGAYPGTIDVTPGSPNDWKQWLDAIDERGSAETSDPSHSIDDLLVKYGVATSDELTERAEARAELRSLRDLAGST